MKKGVIECGWQKSPRRNSKALCRPEVRTGTLGCTPSETIGKNALGETVHQVQILSETPEAKEAKIPTWWGDPELKPTKDSCVGSRIQMQHVSVADT